MWIHFIILFIVFAIGYAVGLAQKEADIKKEIALRKEFQVVANETVRVMRYYRGG